MVKLQLSNSLKQILLDDEDLLRCQIKGNWYLDSSDCVRSCSPPYISLSRFLKNNLINTYDHKDRDRLNFQKENLRICDHSQNGANRGLQVNNITGYKGIKWIPASNKWMARIYVKGKEIYLGLFKEIFDAATAYNFAAEKYFGEFACYNLPLAV